MSQQSCKNVSARFSVTALLGLLLPLQACAASIPINPKEVSAVLVLNKSHEIAEVYVVDHDGVIKPGVKCQLCTAKLERQLKGALKMDYKGDCAGLLTTDLISAEEMKTLKSEEQVRLILERAQEKFEKIGIRAKPPLPVCGGLVRKVVSEQLQGIIRARTHGSHLCDLYIPLGGDYAYEAPPGCGRRGH